MNKKKLASMILLFTGAILILSGCTSSENNMQDQNQPGNTQGYNMPGMTMPGENVPGQQGAMSTPGADMYSMNPGTTAKPMQSMDETARARRMKAELEKMWEITDVSVVLSGEKCIVGCGTIKPTADRNNVIRTIQDRVKQLDTSVKDCAVTDNQSLMPQIKQLSTRMQNKNMTDMNNQVMQLMQKINSR